MSAIYGHVNGSVLLSFSCSDLAYRFNFCADIPEYCDCCDKWVCPSGEPEDWEETWEPAP
jgi:hypothetical protein